ncbi:hypothetical protein AQZ49_01570 [Novosphingobium sp. FSW06-99]|nr:hypothetical protein AQZ49_01570 [Novosphingobium sp. FSW06-99]
MAYTSHEEGIAREAYLDSAQPPVWTWSMGLTAAAGINVLQYRNRPAPIEVCLNAAIERLNAAYLPNVNRAFAGHALNDAQLAAAVSFEWNTDAIGRADWVHHWIAGNMAAARRDLTFNYLGGGQLADRRKREAALFFDNTWPADMHCPVWQVSHPGYRPYKPVATDVMPILQSIMGGA